MAMDRNTRKVLQYMEDMERKVKQMKFIRDLKVEVEINGTGTHKYRYKRGPNRGKVTQ
jgi:hypothetical protein